MLGRSAFLPHRARYLATRIIFSLLAVLSTTPAALAQLVNGDIRTLGFEVATGGGARYAIRNGQWIPIQLALAVPGTEHFQGSIGYERPDLDGDRVEYVAGPIAITAGSLEPRRVWAYGVNLKESPLAGDVRVRDEQGQTVSSIAVPMHDTIGSDTLIVLDISPSPLTLLAALDRGTGATVDSGIGTRTFYRPFIVARLATRDLPDRWFGLEAANIIFWDEPEPDALTPAQLDALMQWVRTGGQLVIGIGPASTRIQKSKLAEILPFRGDRPTVAVTGLRNFRQYFSTGEGGEPLKSPITICDDPLTPDSLGTLLDETDDRRSVPLIAMRWIGSGRVVACTARLKDLTEVGQARTEFLGELVDLNRLTAEFRDAEAKSMAAAMGNLSEPLHPRLTEPTEFRRLASARVLLALAFVVGYILLATLGVWAWLRRRSLTHLSWSFFAATAVVAGALSLMAVQFSRGLGVRIATVSVVDAEAGSPQGRGRVYLGYKSPIDSDVRLSLEGKESFVRGLSTLGHAPRETYATPRRYANLVSEGTVLGAPLRATLKQFEGYWQGDLGGTVRGQLTVDRRTGRLTSDSWIQSDLPARVVGGYLLYVDPLVEPKGQSPRGVAMRVAGLDRRSATTRYLDSLVIPPSVNVLAVEIPELPLAQKVDRLAAEMYQKFDSEYLAWTLKNPPEPKNEPVLPTLWSVQNFDWVNNYRLTLARSSVDANWSAILLASTRNLYLHNNERPQFDSVGKMLTTDGLPEMDVTHWLARGQGVLLLMADRPCPGRLLVDGDPRELTEGRSLLRVRIPISYVNSGGGRAGP